MIPIVIKSLKTEGGLSVSEEVKKADLTTGTIPLDLVKNVMDLHNEANPGSVKQFANKFLELGCGDRFFFDVVKPREPTLNLKDPKQVLLAFYKYSILQNEEAKQFVVYSLGGKLVGSAMIGSFAKDIPRYSCSISNLSISSKITNEAHNFIVSDLTNECKKNGLEPALIANSAHIDAYKSHGYEPTEIPSFPKNVLFKYRR